MIYYKKKKSRKAPIITILLLIALIFFSNRNPNTSRISSQLVNTIVEPVNRFFYSVSIAIQDTYDSAFGSKATQEKVLELTQENAVLTDRIQQMEDIINRAPALQNEYALLQKDPAKYVPATITAKDPSTTFVRFTIDVGADDGVHVGDIVVEGVQTTEGVASAGLVGRVTEVSSDSSKVSSILDDIGNISVIDSSAQDYGIIDGRDEVNLYGYSINTDAKIERGNELFTSGLGGVYPRGYYVGAIVDASLSDDELTKRFVAESPIDFSKLYRVLVVHTEAANE